MLSRLQPARLKTPLARFGHGNSTAPSKVKGKATNPNQGTATILATGPIKLTGKPKANKKGAKPTAATHWVRPISCHQRQCPKRPENAKTNAPTAVKDNQKPACKTTKGSYSNTAHKAAK